jgi:hypothetical protein
MTKMSVFRELLDFFQNVAGIPASAKFRGREQTVPHVGARDLG